MKKIFKMTLFKKIFLLVFCCLLSIEVIHVFVDFNEIVENSFSMLEMRNVNLRGLYSIEDKFNKYLDINNEQFLKDIQDNEYVNEKNYLIVDKNFDMIKDNMFWEKSLERSMALWEYGCTTSRIAPGILFDNMEYDIYYKIEQKIYDYVQTNTKKCDVLVDKTVLNNERNTNWEEIKYLKIDNEVFKDEGENVETVHLYLYYFECRNFNTSYTENEGYKIGKDIYNTYPSFLQKVKEEVLNAGSIDIFNLNGQDHYLIVDNNIYYYRIVELNNQGYALYYDFLFDEINNIKTNMLGDRIGPYFLIVVLLFIVSSLFSHMITKRIYSINDATKKIAKDDLSIKLSEKGNDEVAEMSKNINVMVDKLKDTINQLNHEIAHVKELESLRKDFINQFTHEMKTPLGIINGYSELIEETENEEEKEKYLDIINRETVRINELIQSMLKLSRLEAGKVELNKEALDLEDIVTEIVDEYEVLLMKKNIKVEVITNNKHIIGDRNQIITVIRNFLSNAIKHTETKITITIEKGISVYNEGKLIEEDRLESIWYTFVTHDKSGSGLGLAICRGILELHEYDYGVNNKDNGVEFYFYE